MYLCNALSLGMLAARAGTTIYISAVSADVIAEQIKLGFVQSAVGHADTAALFAKILGAPVPMARVSLSLGEGDACFVGQYIGPRLPEGATTLPEGATIEWLRIDFRTAPRWILAPRKSR